MKKWSLFIAVCLLCSCLDEIEMKTIGGGEEEGDTFLTMTVNIPGVTSPSTYASISEVEEHRIDQLNILAFTKDEQGKEVYSYGIVIPASSLTETSDSEKKNKKMSFTFQLRRMQEDVRLVVLANCSAFLGTIQEGTSKESIMASLSFAGNLWYDLDNFSGFPMWGETSNFISTNTKETIDAGTVDLIRAVAKVEIGVDIEGDPAIGFGKVFAIKEVYLYNVSNKGLVIPDETNVTSSLPTLPEEMTPYTTPLVYTYDTIGANMNAMLRRIYLPEAEAGSDQSTEKGTFLVIRASYREQADNYYRLDFVDQSANNAFLPLLRNTHYMFNITNIRGEGHLTADAAAQSKSSSLSYTITVDDEDLNEYVYGAYYLGVSSGTVYLDHTAGSSTGLTLKTDYSSWTAESNTPWIELVTEGATQGSEVSGTGNSISRQLTIIATQRNTEEKMYRTGTITLRAANLTKEITVIQRLGANSYLTETGGNVLIPVSYANVDGITRVQDNGSYEVKLIWTDAAGGTPTITPTNITGINSDITFSSNTTGNYVIGLYNSSNTVVWSWHIWVVSNFNPEAGSNQTVNNAYTFMDRNLGAANNSSPGLYYQWGRKDPFSVSAGFNIDTIPVITNNLYVAIRNPHTFYASLLSPYDWIGGSQNNNLWNSVDGEKTAYDPCPKGWRVPVVLNDESSPWAGFTGNSKNGATYPLSGGLNMSSGLLSESGARGYVWGASARGNQGFVFRFTGSSAEQTSAFRANAYPVRCVKE